MFNSAFYPCTILSYKKETRTFMVKINGLTDGSSIGIEAKIAYPIGDDDRDTDIRTDVVAKADAWCFFEGGDMTMPVVCFWRTHGKGASTDETRRIRQKNIDILAKENIKINAKDVDVTCKTMKITATDGLTIIGDITQTGNTNQTGNTTSTGTITGTTDVVGGGVSSKLHIHKIIAPLSGQPVTTPQ